MKLYEEIIQDEFENFAEQRLAGFTIECHAVTFGIICVWINHGDRSSLASCNIHLNEYTEEELRIEVRKFLNRIHDWPLLADVNEKWTYLLSEPAISTKKNKNE